MYISPEIIYPQEDFNTLLESFPERHAQIVFEQAFKDEISQSIVFYTNGSKIEEISAVGAACYSPQLNLELMDKLPQYTSVFSAEAWAIYNVIISLKTFDIKDAVIVTDSKSTLQAIQNTSSYKNNYIIPLIKASLEAAQDDGICVQFIWVPSHKGILGNERADELAKRAIRIGRTTSFTIPLSDLFTLTL
ncbi:PREDICTED: ribonuclease H1-like [Wasmannia auropunctata]|uniref:ribonuclease H1-like n=1 Tax=Wasmannia auropunctata TaxID=64793 RepID=UPI0005EDD4A3|nr:PREDICTED: ribonuclease H1-like [Wasmannia auropunctata]